MLPLNMSREPANQDPLLDDVGLLSGYALRAFRRHLWLATLCFAATVALTALLLAVLPPTYEARSQVLAKSTDLIPLLTDTGRVMPGHEAPSPTEGAAELVESRESLTWVAAELDLAERWRATRTRLGRFLDAAFARVLGPPAPEARYESLLEVLADRISTSVADGLVTITVEWHEPDGAFAIAQALERRFLTQLEEQEADQVQATVRLLEERAGRARTELAQATKELQAAADDTNSMTARLFGLKRPQVSPDIQEVAQLERELEKRREGLRRLEAAYEVRVAAAETDLNRLRATLGPSHPDVIDAQRNLVLQSRVPTALLELRREESDLSSRLTRLVPQMTAAQLFERMALATTVDADLEAARERYRQASADYGDVSRRLEGARVELASVDASFPYRFVVTQPPVVPRSASKPNVPLVLLTSVLAAAFLAFLVALLADVFSRRIQEPWQVVRYLGLPVIGGVSRAGARS